MRDRERREERREGGEERTGRQRFRSKFPKSPSPSPSLPPPTFPQLPVSELWKALDRRECPPLEPNAMSYPKEERKRRERREPKIKKRCLNYSKEVEGARRAPFEWLREAGSKAVLLRGSACVCVRAR